MSVCKYMSAHRGLEYLSNWHLRITPPAEFNDPFELKSPTPEMFSGEYLEQQFDGKAESMALEELAKDLVRKFHPRLPEGQSLLLATALVSGPDSPVFAMHSKKLRKYSGLSEKALRRKSAFAHAEWPKAMENARQMVRAILPEVNASIERGFTEKIPSMIGVLCLSKNLNQPLMWSHYADSHRGLMIEFDRTAPALNKRRSNKDEFGFLRDVFYTEHRPTLNIEAVNQDRGFQTFALTKSHHWSYEDELRLVWPLDQCEKTPDGQVSLIALPSSSVVAVTLGCKATQATEESLLLSLASQEDCGHIVVRRAKMHATEFKLVYDPIER